MGTKEIIREWQKEWLIAELWNCGDICNCYNPQITKISPNRKAGYPWVIREQVWEGDFISGPERNELAALLWDLRKEAKKYKIKLDKDGNGRVSLVEPTDTVHIEENGEEKLGLMDTPNTEKVN